MSESQTEDWDGVHKQCECCEKWLTDIELEHGKEGFGHQATCCDCYDDLMRGTRKRPKRKAR